MVIIQYSYQYFQKRGKKRMKAVGTVDVPQAAFMAVLKTDEEIK